MTDHPHEADSTADAVDAAAAELSRDGAAEPGPDTADRAGRRAAHLLPEERAAGGSADPRAQAEIILAESDVREADQEAGPDSFVEHRTSEQAADL
jgi:hypothetical protein